MSAYDDAFMGQRTNQPFQLQGGAYNPFTNPRAFAPKAPVSMQPNQTPAAGATGTSGEGGQLGSMKAQAMAAMNDRLTRQAGLASQFGQGMQPMDMGATIAAIRSRMAPNGPAPQMAMPSMPPMPMQGTMLGMPQIQTSLARREAAAVPPVAPAPVV